MVGMSVKSARTGPMGRGGYRFKKVARLVYATWGPRCWLCEHVIVGGVDAGGQVDHVEPACEEPALRYSVENLRPAHGSTNRCMECDPSKGLACNQSRGSRSLKYMRRKLQNSYGYKPKPEPPPSNPGRPWLRDSPLNGKLHDDTDHTDEPPFVFLPDLDRVDGFHRFFFLRARADFLSAFPSFMPPRNW